MNLTKKEQAMILKTAKAEGILPEAVLRRIMFQESHRLQELARREREIVTFPQALRRCGIEPDDFEDDLALWKSGGGPIVTFKKPRAAGFNGQSYGYRVGDVRKALKRWEQDKLASMAAIEAPSTT